MSSLEAGTRMRWPKSCSTGIIMATTGVLLRKAERAEMGAVVMTRMNGSERWRPFFVVAARSISRRRGSTAPVAWRVSYVGCGRWSPGARV